MHKNKNPKQSDQNQNAQGKNLSNQQRRNEPSAADKKLGQRGSATQHQPSGQQRPPSSQSDSIQSGAEQTGRSNQTITNQDEQRQATNAGSSDTPMGEEETEGDRQREEKLKPYKNVGEDSGETEKKSPVMK
jgi:hypothetical protein